MRRYSALATIVSVCLIVGCTGPIEQPTDLDTEPVAKPTLTDSQATDGATDTPSVTEAEGEEATQPLAGATPGEPSERMTTTDSTDGTDLETPTEGEVSPAPTTEPPVAGPPVAGPPLPEEPAASPVDALKAALIAANDQLTDESIEVGDEGQGIYAIECHAPELKDLSPLAGLKLRGIDLSGTSVTDISPLKGMPLEVAYLENTQLSDISPLEGAPLVQLYLNSTKVKDLSPLRKSVRLSQLNLFETSVEDLSPLENLPALNMLWLNGCPVTDISPLKTVPLVSLTLENTPVSDLSPLKGHGLERLHIGSTKVTDLTPLAECKLTRLIFSPMSIQKGLDEIRAMHTLEELDFEFDPQKRQPMTPGQFWQVYDAAQAERQP